MQETSWMTSSHGGKLSPSHFPARGHLPRDRNALPGALINSAPVFQDIQGQDELSTGSPSLPHSLGCQFSDPKAIREMQSDVHLNMQNFNYKRKGATHLTQVDGPSVFNWMIVHSWTPRQGFLVWLVLQALQLCTRTNFCSWEASMCIFSPKFRRRKQVHQNNFEQCNTTSEAVCLGCF